MKNRLFIINAISYIVVSCFVLDILLYETKSYMSIYGQMKYLVQGKINFNMLDVLPFFKILGVFLFISAFFLYIIYKWYYREPIFKTFFKLIIVYTLVFIVICLIQYFEREMYSYFFYIFFILIPLLIMVLIMLPIFWLNKKIIEKFCSKN
jgi:hypothetical protein